MKRLLLSLLVLVTGCYDMARAQGIPRALALTVSTDTNGIVVAPTNFFTANAASIAGAAGSGGAFSFSTNSFSASGVNVELANTQYLPANRVIDGGSNTYDYTIQDTDLLSIEGENASLTGHSTLVIDGQTELHLFARTNLFFWTPAVWAQTATTGQFLMLTDASDGSTEFSNIDGALLASGNDLLTSLLIGWAAGESYTITSATRDANDVITSATVRWPDGSVGTFTATTINSEFDAIDAYTVTHTASGKTVTQTAVTRNATGAVTAQPTITVSP